MYKITMYSPCLLTEFHDFSIYLISGTYVLNWFILRDDKVKLTKCQNHHHHGGIFDTWSEWVKPQIERAQGLASLAGWPCFMSVWPASSRTRVYMRSRRPRRWRKSMEATPPSRPDTCLGRPATTCCQTNLCKSVELPHGPINTPPPYGGNERTHTTFWRFHLQSSHS
jgi:hypothetical protein